MKNARILITIAVIIVLIFGAAFFESLLLKNDAKNLEAKIINVEDSTKKEDWKMAETNLSSVLDEWPKVESKWSVLLDHAEIDNIEDALIKVDSYIKAKDASSALAELASLKNFINHIPKKEAFSIKNVF